MTFIIMKSNIHMHMVLVVFCRTVPPYSYLLVHLCVVQLTESLCSITYHVNIVFMIRKWTSMKWFNGLAEIRTIQNECLEQKNLNCLVTSASWMAHRHLCTLQQVCTCCTQQIIQTEHKQRRNSVCMYIHTCLQSFFWLVLLLCIWRQQWQTH